MGLLLGLSAFAPAATPKNVILFIGDGMGAEQVEAAGYYFNGASGQFSFEQLSNFGWMTTNLSGGGLTDSAASATAMATGFKVDSDVVSVAIASGNDPLSASPSDGRALTNLVEHFTLAGKSAGLVTNSFITDATPGAFGSHAPDRSHNATIASGYLNGTRPQVLFGGGGSSLFPPNVLSAGYQIVTNRDQLQSLDPASVDHVAGIFGEGQFAYAYDQSVGSTTFYNTNPYLSEMTASAIDILSRNPNGFFLMVENELTDAGGHLNATDPSKLSRTMFEVREMSNAVQKAIEFSLNNPDTLIIVTADHETGGFVTTKNNGIGVLPGSVSGDTRHNATMAPVYAAGPNAGHVLGIIDNTDIFRIATTHQDPQQYQSIQTVSFQQGVNGYAGTTDTQLDADAPNANNHGLTQLTVDQDGNYHVAIRFDGAVESVPGDAQIIAAKLSIVTGNTSNSDGTARNISLHRLLVGFDESTTYANAGNVAGNGFSLNAAGTEDDDYLATPESVFPAPSRNAIVTFDVTESLRAWLEAKQLGDEIDFGWVLFNSGTDGWRPHSADTADPGYRPLLEITYAAVPEPAMLGAAGALGTLLLRRRR